MRTYINAQKPKTIAVVIHHSMLAAKIFAPPLTKVVAKPSEREDKQGDKPSDRPPNGKKIINDKKSNVPTRGRTRVTKDPINFCPKNWSNIKRQTSVLDVAYKDILIVNAH